ncbi:MAG: carboxylating nicotinate-nucleotide diphosphorylase [Acidimicrobiia bacterium]|nr:carboxylating nicotinate-nucleotide diphosphorylase [Acidimicrobiia bacterium]
MTATIRVDLRAPLADVRFLVERALAEDLTPFGDLTSSLLDPGLTATATFGARADGVLAGCLCVEETFAAVDVHLSVDWDKTDGDRVRAGEVFAVARGPFATMLTAERTALNFLGHLSGVATNAARWVAVAAGRVIVWDTRKTTPGYRSLQKAAVRAGGAANHRGNLSDWLMFKDNHLLGTTIAASVAEARRRWPGRTVHVEADTEALMVEALDAGADIILLDNFTPDELVELVAAVAAWEGRTGRSRPLLEASGGITLDTLDGYADTGVDLVSSGAITNSATVLDIGLDVIAHG